MVVVLPVPLTPTIRMTKGCFRVDHQWLRHRRQAFDLPGENVAHLLGRHLAVEPLAGELVAILVTVGSPRSALRSRSSRSSSAARSSFRFATTSTMLLVSACEERARPGLQPLPPTL